MSKYVWNEKGSDARENLNDRLVRSAGKVKPQGDFRVRKTSTGGVVASVTVKPVGKKTKRRH